MPFLDALFNLEYEFLESFSLALQAHVVARDSQAQRQGPTKGQARGDCP